MCVFAHDDAKQERFINEESKHLLGGMQHKAGQSKYTKEIKALMVLFGDAIDERELKEHLEENNGNVALVIEKLTSKLMNIDAKESEEKEKSKEMEKKSEKVKKEEEHEKVGEIKPGINLQGYCNNEKCLASKGKLLVWVNLEFIEISFIPDKTKLECPNCLEKTVTTVIKAMFYNSEHSIHAIGDLKTVESNNYQCTYTIDAGLSYELKAQKIRQLATSIEDLRDRTMKWQI
ncbi:hypothetical protein RFI_40169 [Reticulomyxa filosa]|uniref:Uncharacterized protein n=1 Tax=Reticulomyxa filosa TaxID=46433 RepID=X6L720_RETFI|nr:hypothetical protein RFI_40169 [Reticulomyxa filosa]|eukprot:ETN97362.1 hypothetical protein RFI_40169 [Reticulomyxa filosa]